MTTPTSPIDAGSHTLKVGDFIEIKLGIHHQKMGFEMDLSGLKQLNIRLCPIIVVHRIDPIQ